MDVDERLPDDNITDGWGGIAQLGGAPTLRNRASVPTPTPTPPKPKPSTARVLIDGLTAEQDELLRTVQYRTGLLAGRDSLYLATRQFLVESDSPLDQPTKRQVGAWLKGEPGMQR